MRYSTQLVFYSLMLTSLLHSSNVFAFNLGDVTITGTIQNLANNMPYLMKLVTAIAYVLGMFMSVKAILDLKHVGESKSMYSSRESSITSPLICLSIGAALLYLPTSVSVGLSTFWTNPIPISYLYEHSDWILLFKSCFLIIQFIGAISFVRGLMILAKLGSSHSQPGIFPKGLTHIIGGLFCINIFQLVQVVLISLGISWF